MTYQSSFVYGRPEEDLPKVVNLQKIDQRSSIQTRPLNRNLVKYLLPTEDMPKIVCLRKTCQRRPLRRRPTKGRLSTEDRPKILGLRKTQHRSSVYRRHVKSFVFIGPVEVLFPIEGLSKLFSPQKTCRTFLVYRRPVRIFFYRRHLPGKKLAKSVCPEKIANGICQ